MAMKDGGLYSIGEAAEASGLSVRAIRHYEKVGVIPPPRRHDGNARTGGNRLYSAQDLLRLRFVRQARHLDLGLDEIRRLLEIAEETCPSQHPDYRRILTGHLETVTRRIGELSDLQARLTALLSKDESGPIRHCAGEGCHCLDAAPAPRRARAGSEARVRGGRRRKGRDSGSP